MTRLAQAMVVLASEQLWPNILALVHWQKDAGGLGDLCIYYTDDPHRSADPARRFAAFCQRLYPPIRVHLPRRAGESSARGVLEQIAQWQEELPGRRWIIHATGGTKLMFAGAVQAAALPDTQVVYRELSGQWYRITHQDGGIVAVPLAVADTETDFLPVQPLIEVHYCPRPEARWEMVPAQRLPIAQLTQAGVALDWNWPKMFCHCGLRGDQPAGFLFEQFVAACLLELGIAQVALNARLTLGAGQCLQEIDILANHHGRLLIVDCKLRTAAEEGSRVEGFTSQVRQADTIRRQIGGSAAKFLLLRPGRFLSEAETQLAESFHLDVLSASQSLDFFRLLARFCDVPEPLPPELQSAQTALDAARHNGALEALGTSHWLPGATEPLRGILQVGSHLDKLMEQLRQDWIAYRIDDIVWIRGRTPHKVKANKLHQRLLQLLGTAMAPTGTVPLQALRCAKHGTTFTAALDVSRANAFAVLWERLKALQGKRIFEFDEKRPANG